jgi:4-hydroxythreonine-4-phosphate dehydrogenase
MRKKPRIGVLLGDPTGIGPELVAKLVVLPETSEAAEVVIVGDPDIYRRGAEIAATGPVSAEFIEYSSADDYPLGQVSAEGCAYALASLKVAIEKLDAGIVDAIVYAPLNKQAMKLAGMAYEDELHYFASLLRHTGTVSEINVCGNLWTSRVTSHIPLSAVAGSITIDKICSVAHLLHGSLVKSGVAAPRLAVAALNPHAGEGGLLGTEEITTLAPAVDRLRSDGLDATGPWPADTLFIAATRGDYDGVVTMYHDQGQIALKLLGFDRGVTVAGGLPLAITTPAHGTAFNIAGKGVADVGAMREAFRIACRMARGAHRASGA